jgi:enterochelin esterase family protein
MRLLLAFGLLLAARPALAAEPPAPFGSLAELDAAMVAVERGGDVDAFWARVRAARAMPLIFAPTAVFLHRTRAASVEWRGDFTAWRTSPDATGRRLGASDVFTFRRDFLPAARLDYKIVEDGDRWLVDPLNPLQQLGGFGPNSELRMPPFAPPAHTVRRAGVPRGRFGAPQRVRSKLLGHDVTVRVYEPARPGRGPLPILYVTDGSDYWTDGMGALVVTLDNLIHERRIPPLVAVFVDHWDTARKVNRREEELVPERDGGTMTCRFCDFLVDELLPRVEKPRSIDPARRAILGTSLGGLHAAYMGHRHPKLFRLLGVQSPAQRSGDWLPALVARDTGGPARVAMSAGIYEAGYLEVSRALREAYQVRGVPVTFIEVPDGHSWGHWRNTAAPILESLFGAP